MLTALPLSRLLMLGCLLSATTAVNATETENLGITALRTRGEVTIDGATADWDLGAGIFACANVENQREKLAVWIHLMHDERNLYVLARFRDQTPLNHPGQIIADYGWDGDCLQMRLQSRVGTPEERTSHWTCWRGRDGVDIVDGVYGTAFDQGKVKDAKTTGAKQAFAINADRGGYVQELAFPWALLTKDGKAPRVGEALVVTVEPNWSIGTKGRWSVKDIFKPGVTPNRVFTFMSASCWGSATIDAATTAVPKPLRLADKREFPVRMQSGRPEIDWTGLIKQAEMSGHKTFSVDMPFDGYCSLNLSDARGTVVRQLLNTAFLTKGTHQVRWDGLSTPNFRQPGEAVPAGAYTWKALVHPGIGLRLRGWACNAGSAPWDGATGTENWGGDHGQPSACAASGDLVYLGWSGAEAGKALVACTRDGAVKWRGSRQGMAGAEQIAVDGDKVYAVNWGDQGQKYLYRVAASDGSYVPWPGRDTPDLFVHDLWLDAPGKVDAIDGLAARDGLLYLSVTAGNRVLVVDGVSGALKAHHDVPAPTAVAIGNGKLYVLSQHTTVVAIDLASGKASPFLSGLSDAHGLTVDAAGELYVSVRGTTQQILVFSADGKQTRSIGKVGGRARIGAWTPDGVLMPKGLVVDGGGQLWVAEDDHAPKRISVWNAKTGAFIAEHFGPTSYGALGGAICPSDPDIMVGQGCEWRVDSITGKARCLGTITRDGMENSRFATGKDGRTYLFVVGHWIGGRTPLWIYERLGDARYALRSVIDYVDATGKPVVGDATPAETIVWADADGDGQRNEGEIVSRAPGELKFSGWYMGVTPDLALHTGDKRFAVSGWTACGAPTYNLTKATKMPAAGLASPGGALVLQNGDYGVENGWYRCFDVASGALRWSYPDNFVGVHGSHAAPPPEVGLIRGSYGPCGVATLPAPIGTVWAITTNVGEWHLLTEGGFYLTKLFQGDPTKTAWPEKAVPGAILDEVPPGLGGEDFGGSMTLGKDGKLYVQAGKTGFWNVEVTGLERVRALSGGTVTIAETEIATARGFREQLLQANVGTQRVAVARATPTFSGNLDKDFSGVKPIAYGKGDDAKARTAISYDDTTLYVAWDVRDATPWTNGASVPEAMYLSGDTVDLQLGTGGGDPKRTEAGLGDVRVSIGALKGKPTAVAFRRIAKQKQPKSFSSGVIKDYVMEQVVVLDQARITVTPRGDGYLVQAALPLAQLGIERLAKTTLRGDLGVTFGDQAGQRTRLRSYWSNQHTGIVDDAVFELAMEPAHWGELEFTP